MTEEIEIEEDVQSSTDDVDVTVEEEAPVSFEERESRSGRKYLQATAEEFRDAERDYAVPEHVSDDSVIQVEIED